MATSRGYDYRKRLAKSLREGTEPRKPQFVGNYYIPISPLESISKAVQSGYGTYLDAKNERMENDREQSKNQAIANALKGGDIDASGLAGQGVDLGDISALYKVRNDANPTLNDEYINSIDSEGNFVRMGKRSGKAGAWVNQDTGLPYDKKSAIYDPASIANRRAAVVGQNPQEYETQDFRKGTAPLHQIDPAFKDYSTQGAPQTQQSVDPVVDQINRIAAVESGGQPDPARSTNPTSSAYGATQVTRPTQDGSGFPMPEFPRSGTQEQQKAWSATLYNHYLRQFGGNQNKATQAWHDGLTAVVEGRPDVTGYVDKVNNASPVLGPSATARESAVETAKQQAKQPYDIGTAQAKSVIETEQKDTQARQDLQRKEQLGAEQMGDTMSLMTRYLYPEGKVERDESGRLKKPSTPMILGNTPSDRLERGLYDTLGVSSQKAVNTEGFKRGVRKTVLDTLGGLGAQISDSDRAFIVGQVSNIEKNQNIDEIYDSVAAIEDRINLVKRKYGQQPQPQLPEGMNLPAGAKFLGFE